MTSMTSNAGEKNTTTKKLLIKGFFFIFFIFKQILTKEFMQTEFPQQAIKFVI